MTLGAVPLATVYADRQGYMQGRPPLLDLAYLNIEHWQSSSDQFNILHVARVPILFASGFQEGALKIGAGSAVSNDDPTSKLSYVEHSGAAIEAGRMSLKDLEERMSLMGAQLLVRKPGSRTATEKAIDSADADSALSLMVRNLEDSLEYALQFMADWEKLGPAGEVELVGEIGGLEDMEIAGLMKARELGLLSAETIFGEMQRRGLITDDIDWADEWARLTAEGPPIAIGGAFEAPNTAGGAASTQTPTQPQASGSAAQVGGPAVVTPAGSAGATAAANETPPALAVVGSKESAPSAPDDAASDAAATAAIQGSIAALAAQMTDLLARIAAQPTPQAQHAPTIHITQPAITVNTPEHPAPVVTVNAAPITVNTPDVNVAAPAITVNVPEQPAAQINIAPAAITVNTPDINVAAPAITVTAPTVNVTPAPINVAAPTINVTPPAPPVAAPKPLEIAFNTNPDGQITGASVHPPKPREINFKTNSDGEISGASMT